MKKKKDLVFRSIGFPTDLVKEGDAMARHEGMSFAAYIRFLLRQSIKKNGNSSSEGR